jgi:hypothetical protein
MNFTCLEQRMAQGYIDMFPAFIPDENAPVSISEQEDFYNLIKNLHQLAYKEPLLFVNKLHEDDVYPGRYKKSYGKPKLIQDMRKFTKAVDELLHIMFMLGRGEVIDLKKRQATILSKLGIDDLTKLPEAWNWMATREETNFSKFSHCMFNNRYPYTSEIYSRLLSIETQNKESYISALSETSFKKLENWIDRKSVV